MTWVKLDDGFPAHRKVRGLSDAAFRLHVTALCDCAAHLTDGSITAKAVRTLPGAPQGKRIARAIEDLVETGLWEPDGAGWRLHDFLDWNPSAAAVLANREAARERMNRVRSPSVRTNTERTYERSTHSTSGSGDENQSDVRRTSDSALEECPRAGVLGHRTSTDNIGTEFVSHDSCDYDRLSDGVRANTQRTEREHPANELRRSGDRATRVPSRPVPSIEQDQDPPVAPLADRERVEGATAPAAPPPPPTTEGDPWGITPDQPEPKRASGRKSKPSAPRTVKRLLPDDWVPNDQHREEARRLGVDCDDQARRMRDWAAANGRRMADWDATFRNWLRRSVEYGPGPRNGARRPGPQQGSEAWQPKPPETADDTPDIEV